MKNSFHKTDFPFLSKFDSESVYITSNEDFLSSIVDEIGNILSSRLKLPQSYKDFDFGNVPFAYGIRDLQSLGYSRRDLEDFKVHCRDMILRLEPRLEYIEIQDINIDKEAQSISITLVCYPKSSNYGKFTVKILDEKQ
jgi:predicted component of type VI protein secretion system